jgi:hypothetical protein
MTTPIGHIETTNGRTNQHPNYRRASKQSNNSYRSTRTQTTTSNKYPHTPQTQTINKTNKQTKEQYTHIHTHTQTPHNQSTSDQLQHQRFGGRRALGADFFAVTALALGSTLTTSARGNCDTTDPRGGRGGRGWTPPLALDDAADVATAACAAADVATAACAATAAATRASTPELLLLLLRRRFFLRRPWRLLLSLLRFLFLFFDDFSLASFFFFSASRGHSNNARLEGWAHQQTYDQPGNLFVCVVVVVLFLWSCCV